MRQWPRSYNSFCDCFYGWVAPSDFMNLTHFHDFDARIDQNWSMAEVDIPGKRMLLCGCASLTASLALDTAALTPEFMAFIEEYQNE